MPKNTDLPEVVVPATLPVPPVSALQLTARSS